jgi:hypothetical protein
MERRPPARLRASGLTFTSGERLSRLQKEKGSGEIEKDYILRRERVEIFLALKIPRQ